VPTSEPNHDGKRPMHGKVCLVTGATSGIGAIAARRLAELGATVVGVGRDPARCDAAAAAIRAATGNAQVEFLVADLSSQAAIQALAAAFRARHAQLHVLLNNAGAYHFQRGTTQDGIERTFALNHLGYFLLTQLLLDRLQASAPSRIVNVASSAHRSAQFDLADVELTTGYRGWTAYANSKLANLLFTFELARRLGGSGVTANAVHPGWVATRFAENNMRGLFAVLRPFYRLYQRCTALPPEQGADTLVWLASAREVESVTGKYFRDRSEREPTATAKDAALAQRLWELSERMVAR
jgi:NAD(P)-dependent dehydrogenase (short-subunit alcohol dehydrogenase family)